MNKTTNLIAAAALGLIAAAAPIAPSAQAQSDTSHRTALTFTVDDCEGCRIQLEQGRTTDDPQAPDVWHSKWRTVKDGAVTFDVRSSRTFGVAVLVEAPWEGHTGYTSTVAMRYGGKLVGDTVTFKQARGKKRASACWEGTRQEELTLPLVVREVEVAGVHERVPGTIAFLRETTSWLDPMRRAWKGVLGSQDTNLCR